MKNSIVFLYLIAHVLCSQAQPSGSERHQAFFSPADSQKVFLSVSGAGFFKNNEYFNPIEEGYTLIGNYVEPSVGVQFSKDFRLSAGAGLLKYSGRNGYYMAEPFFRAQYQPSESFQMILGNIYGGTRHKLIEPIYRWERDFTSPLESGLQFLLDNRQIKADVWLNWEQFIMHGDPFQEILSVGISSELFYSMPDAKIVVSSPVQALFRHHGGQINSVDLPMETLANWATGLKIRNNVAHKQLKFIEVSLIYSGFGDFSPQKLQQFKNGFGLYPSLKAGISNFTFDAGYFYGWHYISAMGEKLFHCGMVPGEPEPNATKELVTFKVSYNKAIQPSIQLGTYFESYADIKKGLFDYDYGVHIRFNPTFTLAKYR